MVGSLAAHRCTQRVLGTRVPPNPVTPWGCNATAGARANAAATSSKHAHVGARQLPEGMVGGKNRLTSSWATLPYTAKVWHNRPGGICRHAALSLSLKCFICSWDFLGGVGEAAGRQESSYNTQMAKIVPGNRRSQVTL